MGGRRTVAGDLPRGPLPVPIPARYHALLLTARRPPSDRYVLVNHIEEWLSIDGEAAVLSTNLYPGAIHPNGYTHCTSFSSIPWPTWTFAWRGKKIQREIFCIRGRDIVVHPMEVDGYEAWACRTEGKTDADGS